MSDKRGLAELIARYAREDGIHSTAYSRLRLARASRPTGPQHGLYWPTCCIVAQGSKQVMLGPNAYRYDPEQYLVVSVDVPVTSQVVDASPSRPYLCMVLDLDPSTLGSMLLESGTSAEDRVPPPGMMVSRLTPELRDAAIRLISLLDAPRDLAALAPLAEREILYRLLTGEQGVMLRQIALGDSKLRRVARAIDWIRRHFREPFRIEKLAAEAAMSPSALHAHFKTVTAMSPLQYQKQLRLQEARLLMMGNAMDAARAAYEVGYESPSQFSREYRRLFGNPPARDIARLKQAPVAAGA